MASATIQFRTDTLEKRLIERAAEREGISASELIRTAVRRELGTTQGGQLNLRVNPRLANDLLNKAARMGRNAGELVEVLIRDHLDEIGEADVDPELRRFIARRRAKELLNGVANVVGG